MSKIDLIDMIITEKNLKIVYSEEDDDLSKENANYLKIIVLIKKN